jgi:phosphoglycolate phosphatase-like HAD superfamily hydrolase
MDSEMGLSKNDKMHRIIVDIDNTLWDFASVFEERLKKIVPTIPPMTDWEWDFYMEYISIEELYSIINEIHKKQDLFEPFPSAKWFLESLIDEGFEIIVASHRNENSREATENFFQKNNLKYTELHLSSDKTVLFESSRAIVDDAPHILDEAKQKGLICTGLRYPWNKHTEHPLFGSLEEVLEFILKRTTG